MNCSIADALIQLGVDGRLTADERRRLDAHLGHCAACRAVWDEYRRLSQAASAWTQRAITDGKSGDDFTAQVMAQIDARPQPVRVGFDLRSLGLAAVFVALAAAYYWTGPTLFLQMPTLSFSWPLPQRGLLLPDFADMLAAAGHDTLSTWNALTGHMTLPGWVWSALAAVAAVNGAFAWRALHPTRETAAR